MRGRGYALVVYGENLQEICPLPFPETVPTVPSGSSIKGFDGEPVQRIPQPVLLMILLPELSNYATLWARMKVRFCLLLFMVAAPL